MEEQNNVNNPIIQSVEHAQEKNTDYITQLMSHFASDEPVEFEVDGYIFAYIPASAGDEYEWAKKALTPDGNIDNTIVTKCKLGNVVLAPYPPELIEKFISVRKEWKDCSVDEKYKIFRQMKGSILDKIVLAMNKIDRGEDAIKNP